MRKVKTKWIVTLSKKAKIKVKEGDSVVCGQELAQEVIYNEKIFSISGLKKFTIENLIGQKIVKNQIIYQTGGMFSKKVLAPESGEIIKIDEFDNLYLKTDEENLKIIVSPTEARVVGIDDTGIVLEFRAEEYVGTGLNDDRAWGINGLKKIDKIGELSVEDANKIMIVESLVPEILLKAEVMGLKGVIILNEVNFDKNAKINFNLPVLQLSAEDSMVLSERKDFTNRALLNAGGDRLLLVI